MFDNLLIVMLIITILFVIFTNVGKKTVGEDDIVLKKPKKFKSENLDNYKLMIDELIQTIELENWDSEVVEHALRIELILNSKDKKTTFKIVFFGGMDDMVQSNYARIGSINIRNSEVNLYETINSDSKFYNMLFKFFWKYILINNEIKYKNETDDLEKKISSIRNGFKTVKRNNKLKNLGL